jgi:hypothetical protein
MKRKYVRFFHLNFVLKQNIFPIEKKAYTLSNFAKSQSIKKFSQKIKLSNLYLYSYFVKYHFFVSSTIVKFHISCEKIQKFVRF